MSVVGIAQRVLLTNEAVIRKARRTPWCIHISCLERVARSGSGRDSGR